MEKFFIEIELIPTEEESKALYDSMFNLWGKRVRMLYTGTKAYIHGELESNAVDYLYEMIQKKGYTATIDRG